MQTKANAVLHLTDARYFAAQGIDWLGFDLNVGSPSALPPTHIQAIRGWISGPQFIGEFSALQSPDQVAQAVELLALDAIEIDALLDLSAIRQSVSVPIIQRHHLSDDADWTAIAAVLSDNAPHLSAFILHLGSSWTQLAAQPQRLDLLRRYGADYPIWWDVAVEPAQLPDLLQSLPSQGLCLRGGAEERVGYKSYDELDEVFDILHDMYS